MSKILTIGGATQDVYLHYQGSDCMKLMERSGEKSYMLFESGAKIEVEKVLYYTGGGATNSAVSFKRLGFDVSCFCMIGEDQAGESVMQDLRSEGVDTNSVITTKESPSGISFVINSLRRERTIFAYRGSNGLLSRENIPLELIKQSGQLYITSLSHESAKILRHVVMHAKEHNVPVAINPGISQLSKGAEELKEALGYINILILNQSEARTFMRALREDLYFNNKNFFKEVLKLGPEIVVVTDGANGVHVATKSEILYHPSLPVDVVDTLGAGDAFGSCFVGGIRKGLSVEDALKWGIVNSASVIGHIGAKPGLLSSKELEKRVERIDKQNG